MNNPIIEVTYKIRNPHNRDIRIEIEKGNVIENKDDVYGRQSLVVIKSIETTIEANTTKEVIVETHCINPKKKSPYECNVRPTPIIFEVDIDDMMNRRIIWKS